MMQEAKMEFVAFEAQDVIATSGSLTGIWLTGSMISTLSTTAANFNQSSVSGNFNTGSPYKLVPESSYTSGDTLYHVRGDYKVEIAVTGYGDPVHYWFDADNSYTGAEGQTLANGGQFDNARAILYWLDTYGTSVQ